MAEVAVVIPTRDREDLAMRALDSVLNQNHCDFELVLVDDGSSSPMKRLEESVVKAGQRYLRQENRGVSAARNLGARETSAPYLAFLDSDDVWLPGKLAAQLRCHQQDSDIRISQTAERWLRNGVRVNACHHHEKPSGEFFEKSLELCCVSPSAVMFERGLFEEFTGFDERLRVCEDYELWLRISSAHEIALVEEEFVEKYGGHADQLSRSEPAMDRFRIFAMFELPKRVSLNSKQEQLLREALRSKIEVLLLGARKRDNVRFADLLSKIYSATEDPVVTWSNAVPELALLLQDEILVA